MAKSEHNARGPKAPKRHPAFTYKGHFKPYKSYNFVDKDPVIDELRTLVQNSGLPYSEIANRSGVSAATISNWFNGPTRRPQSASLEAVIRALGFRREILGSNVRPLRRGKP